MDNFKLIVISHPGPIENESQIIIDLFSTGLELFHLRKPHSDIDTCKILLEQIPEEFHNKIVLHQHYSLANNFAVKGIHLKKGQNPHSYNIVSTSCHSITELFKKKNYEYVFLSPIFDSISKENYNSPFKFEDLQLASSIGLIDSKVIALGGIMPSNISEVIEIGFGGVAVLGYLWQ